MPVGDEIEALSLMAELKARGFMAVMVPRGTGFAFGFAPMEKLTADDQARIDRLYQALGELIAGGETGEAAEPLPELRAWHDGLTQVERELYWNVARREAQRLGISLEEAQRKAHVTMAACFTARRNIDARQKRRRRKKR